MHKDLVDVRCECSLLSLSVIDVKEGNEGRWVKGGAIKVGTVSTDRF